MLNKKIIATFATATILMASLTTNTFADLDEKIISANKNYTITNYATYEQKKSYKRAKKSVLNKIYSWQKLTQAEEAVRADIIRESELDEMEEAAEKKFATKAEKKAYKQAKKITLNKILSGQALTKQEEQIKADIQKKRDADAMEDFEMNKIYLKY